MFETYMTFTEEDYEKDGFERLIMLKSRNCTL